MTELNPADAVTVLSSDGATVYGNAKTARKALRDQGLSVNNFYKVGNTWATTEKAAVDFNTVGGLPVVVHQPHTRGEGPSKRALKAQARAEAGISIHSEDYRGCPIVIVKAGRDYIGTYMLEGRTYNSGHHTDLNSALFHAQATVDIQLSGLTHTISKTDNINIRPLQD